ncbi:hypothetical protein DFH08DRAFT_950694 [Mycena albidolilacea]|uniref:Uncharacterized protein n=1 Tax=Mycena albidolilacea TaxID=1033008 RepID=A0AAD7F317_9AGAR|nr:hypothetical protein DFH08DRAFT_950694 [Mycena albidolilacea]
MSTLLPHPLLCTARPVPSCIHLTPAPSPHTHLAPHPHHSPHVLSRLSLPASAAVCTQPRLATVPSPHLWWTSTQPHSPHTTSPQWCLPACASGLHPTPLRLFSLPTAL